MFVLFYCFFVCVCVFLFQVFTWWLLLFSWLVVLVLSSIFVGCGSMMRFVVVFDKYLNDMAAIVYSMCFWGDRQDICFADKEIFQRSHRAFLIDNISTITQTFGFIHSA